MIGFHFTKYDPNQGGKSKFDQLLDIFMQLLTYTSGDFAEALQWMNQLDKEYQLTNEEYGMGDFIEDLKDKGYIDENKQTGAITIFSITEPAFEALFTAFTSADDSAMRWNPA